MNYEILLLSSDSRYFWSGAVKAVDSIRGLEDKRRAHLISHRFAVPSKNRSRFTTLGRLRPTSKPWCVLRGLRLVRKQIIARSFWTS